MARPLRVEFPGAVYHVTSRGNAGGMIFDEDQDRERFLDILGSVVKNHRWLCHAYCLMGNHYHVLIETPEGNLWRGMRQLNGMYTQSYNRRHKRTGHLFQGRYKAILVEKESYLLVLCRYIVLNPVAARLVLPPEEWPWSSYRATAGLAAGPDLLTSDWILSQFAGQRKKACRLYREFVDHGLCQPSPWENLRGGVLLGHEEFVGRFQDWLSEKQGMGEIPRSQRLVHRPSLEKLLTVEKGDQCRAAKEAHIDWGYTLKEIAGYWGIHYSTVSRMVKRCEERMRYGKT